jgi:hypothetical protein
MRTDWVKKEEEEEEEEGNTFCRWKKKMKRYGLGGMITTGCSRVVGKCDLKSMG